MPWSWRCGELAAAAAVFLVFQELFLPSHPAPPPSASDWSYPPSTSHSVQKAFDLCLGVVVMSSGQSSYLLPFYLFRICICNSKISNKKI